VQHRGTPTIGIFPSGAFTRPGIRSPYVALAAAALVAATAWAQQYGGPIEIAGYPHVINGDTVAFGHLRVRLEGIAAPKMDQTCSGGADNDYPCGALSTNALLQLVNGGRIRCRADVWNLYRRVFATCWRGDLDLGRQMVREGQASTYGHFSALYLADEDEARAERRGIWRGRFEEPRR
jgi:endonuclease YncB( thermonuclease family)